MKKLHQSGALDFMLIAVIVFVLAVGGFVLYRIGDAQEIESQDKVKIEKKTDETKAGEDIEPYTFDKLGVSMEILPGWEVTTNHTTEEGVNFYEWAVENPNADGKIILSSNGFRGGFEGCQAPEKLTQVIINDISRTQNDGMMYLSWSYRYDGETRYSTSLVPPETEYFRPNIEADSAYIKNKDLEAGSYYVCLSDRGDGGLKLNNEPAPGFSRTDSIYALSSIESEEFYPPLPFNAESYQDIKTMLISVQ